MTCAFAVRGALKKFPGVEAVDVSLNKGLASVKLKPGNLVTPDQLWEAIKKNGFTPKETRVVVRGVLLPHPGKPQLKVTGTNRSYDLTGEQSEARQFDGKTLTVEGSLTPVKDTAAQIPLQVRSMRP